MNSRQNKMGWRQTEHRFCAEVVAYITTRKTKNVLSVNKEHCGIGMGLSYNPKKGLLRIFFKGRNIRTEWLTLIYA